MDCLTPDAVGKLRGVTQKVLSTPEDEVAGRPFLRKVNRRIEKLGGLEWFFDQVRDAVPMKDIAAQAGCSRPFMYKWMRYGSYGDIREEYQKARVDSAHAIVEEGQEILDDLAGHEVDSADVTLASRRADYRKWRAGKLNDQYADKRGGDININLTAGEKHLQALIGRGRPVELPPDEIEEAEFEVLPPAEAEAE